MPFIEIRVELPTDSMFSIYRFPLNNHYRKFNRMDRTYELNNDYATGLNKGNSDSEIEDMQNWQTDL
jgi:hypothetical protein